MPQRPVVPGPGRDADPGRAEEDWLAWCGPDLLVTLDPITTQECDHRFEAKGHDPGVKLLDHPDRATVPHGIHQLPYLAGKTES
jgi:hypothetical protein